MSAVLLQGNLAITPNPEPEHDASSTCGLSFYKEDEKRKEQTTGETKNLARFLVQYDLVRVVPFASVKKYMFTNNTWRVYKQPDSERLSKLFKKTFQCHQLLPSGLTKYAMLIKVRQHSTLYLKTKQLENPFITSKSDQDEFDFPLPSTSHFLVYGEQQQPGAPLYMFATLCHEPQDFNDIYRYVDATSAIVENETSHAHAVQRLEQCMAGILQRSGQKRLSDTNVLISAKKTKLEQGVNELEYVKTLDRIRFENSKTLPERLIMKTKPIKEKKVTMITAPTVVIEDQQAISGPRTGSDEEKKAASKLKRPTKTTPILRDGHRQQDTTPATEAQSNGRRKEETIEVENKKILKKMVWDKLLKQGYVKRDENTKAYYHQIYQSSQFVLRHVIKLRILSVESMESVVDRHFDFYASMETFTRSSESDPTI